MRDGWRNVATYACIRRFLATYACFLSNVCLFFPCNYLEAGRAFSKVCLFPHPLWEQAYLAKKQAYVAKKKTVPC